MYYIYKIENEVNHKKYIGLTNNVVRRRCRHFTDLRCNRHDNAFLQKEFNIFGEENFSFEVLFSGPVSSQEISGLEVEYIAKYDSYHNGYNQNEGGNFGPSNGGSQLIQADILNILAAVEFMSRPGGLLEEIFGVSRTTISRIKHGENHSQYKEYYESLPLDVRKKIYEDFCKSTNLISRKKHKTILNGKRKLTQEQVFMILYNDEYHLVTQKYLMEKFNIKSSNTFNCILKGLSYQDYVEDYLKLTEEQKKQLASLFSNK